MGGTEIFAPLEALLSQRTVDGYLRQIFILTDGEVFKIFFLHFMVSFILLFHQYRSLIRIK